MAQKVTEAERDAAIDAIMRERGYTCRDDAEWEYAEAHGEPLGCCDRPPINTVDDPIATYGEQALRHPIERARFGLPPLTEAAVKAAPAQSIADALGRAGIPRREEAPS